ncbi:DeoR/GlpR family DNA-binding transcription regulator [Mesorhizobium sp. VK23B]|uniref:DeoR/GlpR family DNA-binding transcription regulator n=1 Tax=Mesorhizobium dulcispinae TaxID=3072316 RepID=A0ABU4X9A1_9HYPH|nr:MULTISPECIES: DeoR/GlpR family DNA-binding transcription regulator [unclassified Mesorhizobium]MDX8464647.1 DeoR/GlpR family DNA-binding transcription regulator [Mesorhizobium sp. VK23B]MDX8471033.1 DeoR/GlpR family DNA-binding transcription regulator [Mesorhizobium sp. VK23A]
MKDSSARDENSRKALIGDQLPSDSRHARQLARRQLMAEAVMAEGTMRIEDLTERFGISLMTAHRDLDELVDKGILRKTRGVVSAAPTSLIESSEVYRSARQLVEKQAIAEAAAAYLEPGQAVFFDDSTTVLQLVPHLQTRVPLTVITNSITLMNEMKGTRDVTLLGLGGQFYNWCNAFMGPVTTAEIRRLRADRAFLSMSAITDDMVFHQSPEMVETKRAMFDSAAMRILLADHTKFERRALHAMGTLDEFDVVIVDDGTPPRQVERMKAKGITVVVAPLPRNKPGAAAGE